MENMIKISLEEFEGEHFDWNFDTHYVCEDEDF